MSVETIVCAKATKIKLSTERIWSIFQLTDLSRQISNYVYWQQHEILVNWKNMTNLSVDRLTINRLTKFKICLLTTIRGVVINWQSGNKKSIDTTCNLRRQRRKRPLQRDYWHTPIVRIRTMFLAKHTTKTTNKKPTSSQEIEQHMIMQRSNNVRHTWLAYQNWIRWKSYRVQNGQ